MPTPSPRVSVRTRKVAIVGLSFISVFLIVAATIAIYQAQLSSVQKINYSQLYNLAETGGAVALSVEGETLTVTKADGSLVEATVTGEATQHEVVQLFRQEQRAGRISAAAAGMLVECRRVGCCLS